MSIAPPLIGFAHESNATAAPSLAGRVHPGSSIAVVAQRRRPAVLLVRDDASHESQASPKGTRAWNASQYTLHEDGQNLALLPHGPGRTRTCVERIMRTWESLQFGSTKPNRVLSVAPGSRPMWAVRCPSR